MAGGRKGDKIDGPRAPGWDPDPWSATGTGERYFDGEKWGTSMRPLGRDTSGSLDFRTRESSWPRRRRVVIPVVFIVLVAAVGWYLPKLHGGNGGRPTLGPKEFTPTTTTESRTPLGVPAAVPTAAGRYGFEHMQPDNPTRPIAWDPCRPIHYVVNPSGAPADGFALVKSAIARVQKATGLHFVYDGPTNEKPVKDRLDEVAHRYPSRRWAPVLIAWSNGTAFPELAGDVEGVTAPVDEVQNGTGVYTSGEVVLDGPELSESATPVRALARAVILHELGHLVGLGHTSDRRQIMFTRAQFNVRDYGAGDLRGLAILGTQPCHPEF